MRLDKFIGHSSDLSRRDIHRAIKRGEVRINGVPAQHASQSVNDRDQITLAGETVALPTPQYLMLNKPEGVVCARTDELHSSVLDLLDAPLRPGLQMVGRLDKDTTGLLLLTDDGQWNHRITSPRSRCPKVYRVTTAEPITNDAPRQFHAGIQLRGEKKPSLPARLTLIDAHNAWLEVHEGRYHLVKRLFAALGNHVEALHRQSIGNLELDPALSPGQWRPLTPEEIASF